MGNACTFWPDQLFGINYSSCCAAHDLAYEVGSGKLNADVTLAQCVATAFGFVPHGVLIATLMLMGVAALGWRRYRWPT